MTDQQPDPDQSPGPDPDDDNPLGNNEGDPEGGDPNDDESVKAPSTGSRT